MLIKVKFINGSDAILQALAGSDEDDEDNWCDS